MRLSRVVLLASLACGTFLPVARGATLQEVLVGVYLGSPRLEAARARLRAVDEEVPAALSGWRPQLAASSSAAMALTSTDGSDQTLGSLGQSVTLSQPLYTGGATTAGTSRAEHAVLAERARLTATEQAVLLEAVEAFAAVRRDRAVRDLARRNEQRFQQHLAATRDRERFGELTRTDIAQAETRLAEATAERIRAEGELTVAEARFRRVVGTPPDELAAAEAPAPPPLPETELDPVVDTLPEVVAAGFELDAARDDIDLARARLRPRLSLDGSLGYERQPSTLIDDESTASIGFTLTVPLYQGGAEYARIRQSRQTAAERRHRLADVRQVALEGLLAARAELASVAARVKTLQVQIDGATFALEGVTQEALIGARTVLDVLDAEQELFAAEVELARAETARLVAAYRLRAAAGQLTAQALQLPVEPHDAEAYYRAVRNRWVGTGDAAEDGDE
ncbi:MAG: TolC family outer membrane protein [Geminicoccaceae bacterium]